MTINGRRRGALSTGLLIGALTMTACGDEPAPSDGGAAAKSSATSTATGTATDAAVEARAKSRFIKVESLGAGWRLSDPQQPGFRLTVCGVDIEPEPAEGSARRRFTKSALGPFVMQYVQAHRDGMAAEVVAKLKAALPTCTEFETKGESPSSPTSRFTIDKATFTGIPDNAVAWRMTSQGDSKITQDIALIADGEFLIGLVAFSPKGPQDPTILSTAVRAVPAGN